MHVERSLLMIRVVFLILALCLQQQVCCCHLVVFLFFIIHYIHVFRTRASYVTFGNKCSVLYMNMIIHHKVEVPPSLLQFYWMNPGCHISLHLRFMFLNHLISISLSNSYFWLMRALPGNRVICFYYVFIFLNLS